MRRTRILLAAPLLSLLLARPCVPADVAVSLAISDGELRTFHAAIGTHFHVAERDVIAIRTRKIPDDELPIVFHVAGRARVAPGLVVDLRLRGWSWMQVVAHFGLTAEVFHVEVAKPYGPPYGNAYGYFKNRKREEWGAIRLTDAEAVHLANVRFLAEFHGCSADVVLSAHQAGEGFARLHARVKEAKAKGAANAASAGNGPEEGKGKGASEQKPQDRPAPAVTHSQKGGRDEAPKASRGSAGRGGRGGRRGK
ncbi:MAG: hypothetical protein JXP34_20965 [Planctomycetes bacterium]|nr:hypothetical protein [Planctomycetota bacterium]